MSALRRSICGPENIGRRVPVDLGVVGDVRATLAALLPLLKQKRDGTHLAQAQQHYAKARKELDDLAKGTPGKRLIHPQQIAKAISDQAAADAIFTCDVGLPTVWAARYLAMNGKRRLLGLVLARLDGQCDGAGNRRAGRLSRPAGDLAVGRRRLHHADGRFHHASRSSSLPVKVVVFNNGTLGFVELEQKSTGFLDFGTGPREPELRGDGRSGRHPRHPARRPGPRSRTELPRRFAA